MVFQRKALMSKRGHSRSASGPSSIKVIRRFRKAETKGSSPLSGSTFVSILPFGEQVFFPDKKETEWVMKPVAEKEKLSWPDACPKCTSEVHVKLLIHSQTWLCTRCRERANATDREIGLFAP